MSENESRWRSVTQKWGFGMAPVKPAEQAKRLSACEVVLEVLDSLQRPSSDDTSFQSALSEMKGLFNRVARQDQWDWFTVSRQLGYPSGRIASVIADGIAQLRKAVIAEDCSSFDAARNVLRRLPARRCLSVFLGRAAIVDEAGAGWVYILSCREFADLLKIGMTTRTVEQRAQEISTSTGVPVPFGVRRCWRVSDPALAERLVHAALAETRLRSDREFFRIDFWVAARRVEEVIRSSDLEVRTLDRLASLEGLP